MKFPDYASAHAALLDMVEDMKWRDRKTFLEMLRKSYIETDEFSYERMT